MADYTIKAEPRDVVGKQVRQLRAAGLTPGIIYGHGMDPVAVQVNSRELATLFRTGGRHEAIAVELNGTTYDVTVQELQRHVTRGDLMHIDFIVAG